MDPREELYELIREAKEHLLYCRELGLTDIGEENRPVSIKAPAAGPEESSAVQPVEETRVIESHLNIPDAHIEDNPPSTLLPPQSIPQSANRMTTKKEKPVPAAPSLFDVSDLALPDVQADETLEDIRQDLGDCKRCKLWTTRTKIVFGEGSPKAELMFVGEGPGADEDATGRPFVGRAGQLLTKMIEAIGLKREDVYIANVVKSRPPGNRAPEKDEVSACIPFLFRQIAAIRPRLIVALGNPAMQALLDTRIGITRMRGELQDYPRIPEIKVMPTFHPAYLLRSPDKKREAWEDLKKIREFLKG
jgi:DNA polymerase